MTQQSLKRTSLALCLFAAAAAAFGQSGTATSTKPASDKPAAAASDKSGALAGPDRKFVEEAAQGGMMEVQLGAYAAAHASNEQVKKFAQRMVTDHSKANDELKAIATSKGVDIPKSLDPKHHQDMEKLQKADGAAFDRAYMEHMLKDHQKDVKKFETQAKTGRDPEVKAFAAKTLPTLQEHLRLAQTTYDTVTGTTTSSSGTRSSK